MNRGRRVFERCGFSNQNSRPLGPTQTTPNAETSRASGPPNKKTCNENEMNSNHTDTVGTEWGEAERKVSTSDYLQVKKLEFDKASNGIAQEFRAYNQIFYDNVQKIEKLQEDLDKSNNRAQNLERKNTTLIIEKEKLEQTVAALKEQKKKSDDGRYIALENAVKEERETFESEKNVLMVDNAALKMETIRLGSENAKLDAEKKALEQKNAELELNQIKIMQIIQPSQPSQ